MTKWTTTWKKDGKMIFEKSWQNMKKAYKEVKLIDAVINACNKVMTEKKGK
jgi:hypothetical protein